MTFTFGNDGPLVNGQIIKNYIKGRYYTCPQDGQVLSITAGVQARGGGRYVKCLIYEFVSVNQMGSLVGETESIRVPADGASKRTFNIINGPVYVQANTVYFLMAWGENLGNYPNVAYIWGEESAGQNVLAYRYHSGFPNPPDPGGSVSYQPCWPVIYATCSEILSGSADLKAEFNARKYIPQSEDFFAKFIVRQETFESLKATFDVGQDSCDLKGIFEIGKGSLDLLAMFHVGQDSIDLRAVFSIRYAIIDLPVRFIVRQERFIKRRIFCKFFVRIPSLDLKAVFVPRRSDALEIYCKAIIRQGESQDLKNELIIRNRGSSDLAATFFNNLYWGPSLNIPSEFEVKQLETRADEMTIPPQGRRMNIGRRK